MRRFGGVALSALFIACSPAPSATPGSAVTPAPSASTTPGPSASAATSVDSPKPSQSAPTPSQAPVTNDQKYAGSFPVLSASPRTGFSLRIECSGLIGQTDPVAIVSLTSDEGGDLVLRDYADIAHPRTACTFREGNTAFVQLIDSRHVVIQDNEASDLYAVVELPRVQYSWFHLPTTKGWGSELITVGPALDRIVWKQVNPDGTSSDTIYLSTATRTRVLVTLPDTNAGRCGSSTDSIPGRYTTSGSYLYVLNQPILPNHSLVIFKGREPQLSIVPPHVEWAVPGNSAPYMAVWSPVSPALYWSRGGDVWRWTPDGGQQKFIAGVSWYDPTISADGRYLAYSASADSKSHVYLVDLTRDAVPHRIGDGQRARPRFLNSRQLWYTTGAAGGCTGPANPYRIYDVSSGAEDGSIIRYVSAAWPATSSNY